jgi:hypothetical protein
MVVHDAGADGVDRVKVRFRLARDEEGWPPADSEELWAVAIGPDVVRIDSIPWFVRNLALGDLITVSRAADGVLHPGERLRWSGNCTIRVVALGEEGPAERARTVLDTFAGLGADGEVLGQYGMVALNVPPDADLAGVKRLLDRGEDEGWWSYEEGCVGDRWQNPGS